MPEYKTILGSIATIIAFVGYGIYFRQILIGKIKPHAFSWFIWGLLTVMVFLAQFLEGAGAGSWMTAATAVACLLISVLAFYKGDRYFDKTDWILLISALLSLFLWQITQQPLLSVILVTLTDLFGTILIIRKALKKPLEESVTLFTINSIKAIVALFAMEAYSLITWLYPAYLVLGNGVIALVVVIRRLQMSKGTRPD